MFEALVAFSPIPFSLCLVVAKGNFISEVGLFIVISLAIALTGAAFSVVFAFRDRQKEDVDKAIENAPNILKGIEENQYSTPTNIQASQRNKNKIDTWAKWWNYCLYCPMLIFCFFVVVITVIVLCQKNPAAITYKWWIFRIIIGAIFAADIGAIVFAYTSYCVVRHNYKELDEHRKMADEALLQAMEDASKKESIKNANNATSDTTPVDPTDNSSTAEPKTDQSKDASG